jgi:hypothetical protein
MARRKGSFHRRRSNGGRKPRKRSQLQPAESALKHPVCLSGERRCPPEDVGGVHGYQEFLVVIFDPKHEEFERMVHWAGGHFVDEFDVKAVNQTLSRIRWPVRHRR